MLYGLTVEDFLHIYYMIEKIDNLLCYLTQENYGYESLFFLNEDVYQYVCASAQTYYCCSNHMYSQKIKSRLHMCGI